MIFLTKFQKLTILVSAIFSLYEFILFVVVFIPAHESVFLGVIGNIMILLIFMVVTYYLQIGIYNLLVNHLKPNYLKFKGLMDGISSSVFLIGVSILLFVGMKLGTYLQVIVVIGLISLLIAFTLASFASKFGDF
jgi:hypothetical protein